MRHVLVAIAVAVVTVWARAIEAHQSSTKYVELGIADDRATISLRFAPGDVTEPMHVAPDARPSAREAAAAPGVPAFVARWLEVRVPSAQGPIACAIAAVAAHAEEPGFVVVTWSATCPHEITTLALDFTVLFALDKRMEALVTIEGSDDAIRVTAATSPLILELGTHTPIGDGLRGAFAPERIAFAWLIVLVALASTRTFGAAARTTALLVASYAFAFAFGSCGAIGIAPKLASVAVAATLAYAGAEVAVHPHVRWRTITFVLFGALHGIARPIAGGAGSILVFNIVALIAGEAWIIGVLLPLVRWIVRPRFYPMAATVVGVGGLVWCVCAIFGGTS